MLHMYSDQFIFNTCVHSSYTCVNSSLTYFGCEKLLLLEILSGLVFGITWPYPLWYLACRPFFDLFCLLLGVFSIVVSASDCLRLSQSSYWIHSFLVASCIYCIVVSLYWVNLFCSSVFSILLLEHRCPPYLPFNLFECHLWLCKSISNSS